MVAKPLPYTTEQKRELRREQFRPYLRISPDKPEWYATVSDIAVRISNGTAYKNILNIIEDLDIAEEYRNMLTAQAIALSAKQKGKRTHMYPSTDAVTKAAYNYTNDNTVADLSGRVYELPDVLNLSDYRKKNPEPHMEPTETESLGIINDRKVGIYRNQKNAAGDSGVEYWNENDLRYYNELQARQYHYNYRGHVEPQNRTSEYKRAENRQPWYKWNSIKAGFRKLFGRE